MAKKSKKSSKRKERRGGGDGDRDEIVDERFAAASSRPQFRRAKNFAAAEGDNDKRKNEGDGGGDSDDEGALLAIDRAKAAGTASSGLGESLTRAIASDDRFRAALDGEKFGCVPTRDKYGRRTKRKSKSKKRPDDRKEGSDDEGGDDDDEEEDESIEEGGKRSERREKEESDDEGLERDDSAEARIAYLNALSRGDISASSDSDEDSSDEVVDGDKDEDDDDASASSADIRGRAGILDPARAPLPGDAESDEGERLTDEPSPYLCILNLNWERTRAVDVYAMLRSFCPPGTLERVEVYPSDFGRERMERERREGPVGLWKDKKVDDDDDDDEEEGGEEESGSDGSDSEGETPSPGKTNKRSKDIGDNSGDDSDADASEDEEDVLNLADATAKLYSHFPPQSTIMKNSQITEEEEEGFDVEKLREYEASKLRYYFAVATFRSAPAAGEVYENVDGMEMEGSAAEIDVRVLPTDQYDATIEGRTLRDSCDQLPAKYAPPENVVTAALRQSRVTCSWERGDAERESKLTKYGMGKEAWEALATGDDVGFYLATSDNSSEEEEESEGEAKVAEEEKGRKKKGSSMRAMLGLAGSDSEEGGGPDEGSGSDDDDDPEKGAHEKRRSDSSSTESESDQQDDGGGRVADADREATFTPGKRALEEKIRSKLLQKSAASVGGADIDAAEARGATTPFQKYLEKRREKRRERKRAARGGRASKDDGDSDGEGDDGDGMYDADPEFGVARFSDEEGDANESDVADAANAPVGGAARNDAGDGFFLVDTASSERGEKKRKKKELPEKSEDAVGDKVASTKEELELLVAGDDDEEHEKDYDMRGIAKLEKNASKKLRGKRKRKLESLAANLPGRDFRVDARDDRFAAMLDGTDDRYGVDRTNPAYRETGAMRELLEEQSRRRRRRNKGKEEGGASDGGEGRGDGKERRSENGDGGWVESGAGATELSSLVRSLQRKVSKERGDEGSKRSGKRKKKEKA